MRAGHFDKKKRKRMIGNIIFPGPSYIRAVGQGRDEPERGAGSDAYEERDSDAHPVQAFPRQLSEKDTVPDGLIRRPARATH